MDPLCHLLNRHHFMLSVMIFIIICCTILYFLIFLSLYFIFYFWKQIKKKKWGESKKYRSFRVLVKHIEGQVSWISRKLGIFWGLIDELEFGLLLLPLFFKIFFFYFYTLMENHNCLISQKACFYVFLTELANPYKTDVLRHVIIIIFFPTFA